MESFIIEGQRYAARSMQAARLSHRRYQERTADRTHGKYVTAVNTPSGSPIFAVESDNLPAALALAAEFIENGANTTTYSVSVTDIDTQQSLLNHTMRGTNI